MTAFRIFLLCFLVALLAYTAVTISREGWNLMPVFFNDMARMAWPGQFNLDFTGFLALSGLWVAWRDRFSPLALAMGVLAFFGGMLFLTIFLLVLTARAKGDMAQVLLGARRP
jgi:hypothetical protein